MTTDSYYVASTRAVTPRQAAALATLGDFPHGFRAFLPYWNHIDRETGETHTFSSLWAGQDALSRLYEEHRWVFALKAGKLGFTELECAWDGYVARFGPRNARVHLFSLNQLSARSLLDKVKYGLDHLPDWMQMQVLEYGAGANNSTSVKYRAGPDDIRTIVSYPCGENVSIDETCTHAHCDEFCRWSFFQPMWAAVQSTISPAGGSCHIVSRGNGPGPSAQVYRKAKQRQILSQSGDVMRAFFAPYDARPGRGRTVTERAEWLARQAVSYEGRVAQWAPTTDTEALQGDESYVYPQFENPPGKHITPAHPWELPLSKKIAVGIDPGAVNPTAMGLWGENSAGRRHLFAEFYRAAVGLDDIVDQLAQWQKWAGRRLVVAVPADEKTLAPTLNARGFHAVAANTDINAGIQQVTRYLNAPAGTFTIHDSCVHHIEEFQDYRNSEQLDRKTRVAYAGERPLKHHADAMDEMRYSNLLLSAFPEVQVVTTRGGRRILARR